MHGLIFETSVWLLAESTRLLSSPSQVHKNSCDQPTRLFLTTGQWTGNPCRTTRVIPPHNRADQAVGSKYKNQQGVSNPLLIFRLQNPTRPKSQLTRREGHRMHWTNKSTANQNPFLPGRRNCPVAHRLYSQKEAQTVSISEPNSSSLTVRTAQQPTN